MEGRLRTKMICYLYNDPYKATMLITNYLLFKIEYMKSITLKCLDMNLEPLNQSIFKDRNIGSLTQLVKG